MIGARITDFSRHPIRLVKAWQSAFGEVARLHFSTYAHTPGTVIDKRKLFEVSLKEVDAGWLTETASHLKENEELALNSLVNAGDAELHIPMVDFCSSDVGAVRGAASAIENEIGFQLHLFSSGRSFHGYGTEPLTHAKWIELSGLLLLVNHKGIAPLVDARWVGHRLIGGYWALRWSCNTLNHPDYPQSVD